MSNPYLGEIRLFAGSFAPLGWAMCDGSLIAIANNDALYSLLGTTYGGDGVSTFGLPDLRGRLPIHQGTGAGLSPYVLGQKAGSETITLSTQQMAQHNHAAVATANSATSSLPGNTLLATVPLGSGNNILYAEASANPTLDSLLPQTISTAGGSQPHDNLAPFLCLTFIIATAGVYPSQN